MLDLTARNGTTAWTEHSRQIHKQQKKIQVLAIMTGTLPTHGKGIVTPTLDPRLPRQHMLISPAETHEFAEAKHNDFMNQARQY